MPDNLPKEHYEAILETMADGLFTVDAEGIIQLWNRAIEAMTGFPSVEAIGKHRSILQCSDMQAGISAAEGRSVEGLECVISAKDGKRIPILKNARPLFDAKGKIVGAVVTMTDISLVKELTNKVANLQKNTIRIKGSDRLVGKSDAMQEVYHRIELAQNSDAAILIFGETGTGKELVAEAIHSGSARKNAPLVKVNCSALPESLLESELFGHVKGAFTGAVRDKIGRFELAEGGIIFLDEIGDISPLIQLKLLRVIQEKEFERVGESFGRKADIRVIAATNKDLRSLVNQGRFREDLYYRLHVFAITVPPLRDRKDDIPLLVEAFIKKFSRDTGKNIKSVSNDVMHCLMDHCFPGNVRELENAIEHAFVTCQGREIGIFDLPVEIRMTEIRSQLCKSKGEKTDGTSMAGNEPLTRERLVAILKDCNWNKAEAARRIGITRTTVWRKMKEWEIPFKPE